MKTKYLINYQKDKIWLKQKENNHSVLVLIEIKLQKEEVSHVEREITPQKNYLIIIQLFCNSAAKEILK